MQQLCAEGNEWGGEDNLNTEVSKGYLGKPRLAVKRPEPMRSRKRPLILLKENAGDGKCEVIVGCVGVGVTCGSEEVRTDEEQEFDALLLGVGRDALWGRMIEWAWEVGTARGISGDVTFV